MLVQFLWYDIGIEFGKHTSTTVIFDYFDHTLLHFLCFQNLFLKSFLVQLLYHWRLDTLFLDRVMSKLFIQEVLEEYFQIFSWSWRKDRRMVFLHIELIIRLFAISTFEVFYIWINLLFCLGIDDEYLRYWCRPFRDIEEFIGLLLIFTKVNIKHIVVIP